MRNCTEKEMSHTSVFFRAFASIKPCIPPTVIPRTMKFSIIPFILFNIIPVYASLILYTFEVDFNQDGTDSLWPIINEYEDISEFKVGNLSSFYRSREYFRFVLTPGGQLMNSTGCLTGFTGNGSLGLYPQESESFGFSIIDDQLAYNERTNWTLCPMIRNDLTMYTIKYSSSCSGGLPTQLHLINEDVLSSVDNIQTLTHVDSEPTTTLRENSFQSLTLSHTASSFAYTLNWSFFTLLFSVAFFVL